MMLSQYLHTHQRSKLVSSSHISISLPSNPTATPHTKTHIHGLVEAEDFFGYFGYWAGYIFQFFQL